MKIELTAEQFNKIQDEIIRLEDELSDNKDTLSGWRIIGRNEEINKLKLILRSEEIDLDQIN